MTESKVGCYLCPPKSDKLATFSMAGLDTFVLDIIVRPRCVNNDTVVFVRLVVAPRPGEYWCVFHIFC